MTETAPETQRVEIDLPGQIDLEMVGFPIIEDSPILTRPDLPSWIQPVMVARQEKVLTWADAKTLLPGDYAYFLVPTDRAQRLDRLFAASEAIHSHHPVAAFNFTGDIPLDELETAYGLTIPDDLRGLTVTQAFQLRCEDRIGMGDRIQLGPASLTVAELDGEDVKQAALEIDEVELPPQPAGRRWVSSTSSAGFRRSSRGWRSVSISPRRRTKAFFSRSCAFSDAPRRLGRLIRRPAGEHQRHAEADHHRSARPVEPA